MYMRFIDLFAGIGGIKIAFENAGFQCVFSNDFDRNVKTTFDINVSSDKQMILGDIQKLLQVRFLILIYCVEVFLVSHF
jgi:DNA (cytosine-5)-methyltransferase 1